MDLTTPRFDNRFGKTTARERDRQCRKREGNQGGTTRLAMFCGCGACKVRGNQNLGQGGEAWPSPGERRGGRKVRPMIYPGRRPQPNEKISRIRSKKKNGPIDPNRKEKVCTRAKDDRLSHPKRGEKVWWNYAQQSNTVPSGEGLQIGKKNVLKGENGATGFVFFRSIRGVKTRTRRIVLTHRKRGKLNYAAEDLLLSVKGKWRSEARTEPTVRRFDGRKDIMDL